MTSEKKSFLLAQLQEAIDEAVSESGRVGDIVEEMKRNGYDLCLMLESTVTISPTEPRDEQDEMKQDLMTFNQALSGEMQLTDHDLEFLRELNIAAA